MRLLLLIIFSIMLMVFDQRLHYLKPVRNTLSAFVAPLQYLIDAPIQLFGAVSTNISSRQTLLEENAALKSKQLFLQAKLQKLTALQNENTQLRALLKSSPHLNNIRTEIANLLAVSTEPLVSEVVLDKGSRSGIYIGQPVLDANGIMGQIIQVGPLTSRLLLISDLRSAVPVQNARNGVRGIVVGQGRLSKLALTNIPDTVDVQAGDVLVSSGLGGHYPEGYPVGVVSHVQHNTGAQFSNIEVKPSAQLDRNQQVLLIWPPPTPAIDVPKLQPAAKSVGKKSPGKDK